MTTQAFFATETPPSVRTEYIGYNQVSTAEIQRWQEHMGGEGRSGGGE